MQAIYILNHQNTHLDSFLMGRKVKDRGKNMQVDRIRLVEPLIDTYRVL